ncbi:MAG: RES domain-containing protein [Acetobacteraceae bacterium]|nr:RES domain-containing protein [Acetobacteraceae bacterium]
MAYRAHDPRWAWTPTSGEGAAAKGGRFNRVGVPALYLALTLQGMFLEMGHGLAHRFEPLTVCSYVVDVEGLADLRDEAGRAAWGADLADMACAWAYERAAGRKPASWTLAERLIGEGVPGILVPSFAIGARPEMSNLVLWRWGEEGPHLVRVHDPSGRLPLDQSSWR